MAKQFICGLCGYSARRQWNLKKHVEDVHTMRTIRICCTRCSLDFQTWYEMVQHRNKCLLHCSYPGCSWTTTDTRRVAPHKRAHLVKIRRMME